MMRALALLALLTITTPSHAETAADAGIDFAAILNEDQVRAQCVRGLAEADDTCTPDEFGEIGAVDGRRFAYAKYKIVEKAYPTLHTPRVIIFERMPTGLRPTLAPQSDPAYVLYKPVLIHSGARTLLHVPGYESGTGNFNRESLYVWSGKNWRSVDTTSWLDDLARRLPKGLSANKGIYPDYATMTAATALWRRNDSNACAEGGRAAITLAWRGDAIALKDVRKVKAGECGEAPERRR
jgi:hypothetical protein